MDELLVTPITSPMIFDALWAFAALPVALAAMGGGLIIWLMAHPLRAEIPAEDVMCWLISVLLYPPLQALWSICVALLLAMRLGPTLLTAFLLVLCLIAPMFASLPLIFFFHDFWGVMLLVNLLKALIAAILALNLRCTLRERLEAPWARG